MPNRIKELDGLSVGRGGSTPVEAIRPAVAVGSGTAGSSPAGSSADSVHITPDARLLATLSRAVKDAPEINTARVADLQQAIDGGQYRVDPDQTAARLLRLEQDLGETQQR